MKQIFPVTAFASQFFKAALIRYKVSLGQTPEKYWLLSYLLMKTYYHRHGHSGTIVSASWLEKAAKVRGLSKWLHELSNQPKSIVTLVTDYNKPQKQARVYKVADWFMLNFLEFNRKRTCIQLGRDATRVDLFTLEPVKQNKEIQPSLYDQSRHLMTSSLVRDAINAIKPLPYNYDFFRLYVGARTFETATVFKFQSGTTFVKKQIVKKKDLDKESERYRALYIRDASALEFITQFRKTHYQPVYEPAYTGRVSELGAGYQGLRGLSKAVLVYDKGLNNYDLELAHLTALKNLTLEYETAAKNKKLNHHDWRRFERTIMSKPFQKAKATQLGLSSKQFKKILYGFIYSGGSMRIKPIRACCLNDERLSKLENYLFPLKKIIDCLWFYIRRDDRFKPKKGVKASYDITNLTGCRFLPDKALSKVKRRRKILAHLIQGIEKHFVHTLTIACKKSGINVVSDEHDGIVTDKPIPQNIIDDVTQINGYGLKLTVKPFESIPRGLMNVYRGVKSYRLAVLLQRVGDLKRRFGSIAKTTNAPPEQVPPSLNLQSSDINTASRCFYNSNMAEPLFA